MDLMKAPQKDWGSQVQRMKEDSWRLAMMSSCMGGKQKGMWRTGSLKPQMLCLLLWCSARHVQQAACHFIIQTSPHASQSTPILNIQHSHIVLNIFNDAIDMHLSKRNTVLLLHGARSGLSFHEHMFLPVRERIKLGIFWHGQWLGILNWCQVLVYLNIDTIKV